ncbi:hypothetical protein [Rhizobium sp. SL86]|uniref:hypothetical protein n=1 Tax=Rhizobium sp. SL86 TaxID=2995148 RepID=UPI0022738409|nr:hypothetical protein [Rhizobium sp. SL86]MCY1666481.1 hypothetical protein [Rhizobium sp. SL86]
MNVPAHSLCRDTKMQKFEILNSAAATRFARAARTVPSVAPACHSYPRNAATASNMYDIQKPGVLLSRASHDQLWKGVAA